MYRGFGITPSHLTWGVYFNLYQLQSTTLDESDFDSPIQNPSVIGDVPEVCSSAFCA